MVDNQITRETAHHIAQRFLDWGLIADLEGDQSRGGKLIKDQIVVFVYV